jgi:predicted helicase
LKRRHSQGRREEFDANLIRRTNYRPFVPRWLYQSSLFIYEAGGLDTVFPVGKENRAICFSDIGSRTEICIVATNGPADLHFGAAIDIYQQAPLFRFSEDGQRLDNVTDWALRLFGKSYGKFGLLDPNRGALQESKAIARATASENSRRRTEQPTLTKEAIFHYVYAVLYDPNYRETYALNLRREFPRIPFYRDFWRWSNWGRELMQLHVGFDTVDPWPLKRVDKPPKQGGLWSSPAVLLKADKAKGIVYIDSETSLTEVPEDVWAYRLGNRSAMEWVLDQHKERKPKDPVIAASFNTYRFTTFKEQVIDLLGRVARVSVETVRITEQMKGAQR